MDPSRRRLTRRAFIGAGVAAGAALTTRLDPFAWGADPAAEPWVEASIHDLLRMMARRELTSVELTQGYLDRIEELNPLLGAVIQTNPDAPAIAARLDRERRLGHSRGLLHGIPVLLKDNIATDDAMETTAGSLALVGARVPADATIVTKLRNHGAVILGKANLSEWANFRGFNSINGWSGRGGFTRDPYLLSFDPVGSSSGSAVAPAANLCAAAVGTETDGSIVSPAGNNLVVGLKPTLGLLSQKGIIPIAHSQDTAGPMARTVQDAAIMLGAMRSPFGRVRQYTLPGYGGPLRRGALRGARIGVDRRYFTEEFGGEPDLVAVAQRGLDAMEALGATLVDTDTGDPIAYGDAEFLVLLTEFKVQVAQYLRTLRGTSLRTLADLIAFNREHCTEEMPFFGQELFELAEGTSGDLRDPDYRAARALSLRLARSGIDGALRRDRLQAIVAPSFSFASSPAAVAGYPNLSVPAGLTPEGKPAGVWMYSGFLRDLTLLRFGFDLEQELQARTQPEFLGEVPPEPPHAGICAPPLAPRRTTARGLPRLERHLGTGKPLPR
jgi:amidase